MQNLQDLTTFRPAHFKGQLFKCSGSIFLYKKSNIGNRRNVQIAEMSNPLHFQNAKIYVYNGITFENTDM